MMIKIMANENRDSYKANSAVIIETVRVARDWLKSQMDVEWEKLVDKSIRELFNNKQGFANAKSQGVGKTTIKAFLGKDWKDWEIQDALSQMEETDWNIMFIHFISNILLTCKSDSSMVCIEQALSYQKTS